MGLSITNVQPDDSHATGATGFQTAGSTNSNTDLVKCLNIGGVNGYINAYTSGTLNIAAALTSFNKLNIGGLSFGVSAPGNFPATAQVRQLQILCDCEAGYGVTSLPIGFNWVLTPWTATSTWSKQYTATGNVYAFSSNATAPATFQTTAPTGGFDVAGTGALNSGVCNLQSLFSANFSVRQTASADGAWRGFPEWISTLAQDPAGVTGSPSPFITGNVFSSAGQYGFTDDNGQKANLASWGLGLQLGSGTSPIPPQGANIQGPLYLAVGYNQAPVATVNIGGSTGTVALTTLTPTVSWAYSDPENDPQAGYVVLVWGSGFNAATLAPTNIHTWPTSSKTVQQQLGYQPLWASGLQNSTANNYTLPAGVLQPGGTYTIQVLVTDYGSQGRYSSYSTGTINVTVPANPILTPDIQPQLVVPASGMGSQPAYAVNASSGAVTLPVKPRINNMTNANALASVNVVSSTGSYTGVQVGANAGDIYTGILDVQVTANRTPKLTLTFFNAAGSSIGTATRTARGYGIPAPGQPTVTVVGATGATTYSYIITALNALGETVGSLSRQITNGNAALSVSNFNTVSWTAMTGATSYNVYRTYNGVQYKATNTAAVTYNDQLNTGGTGASPPTASTASAVVRCWVQAWAPVGTTSAQLTLATSDFNAGTDTMLVGHQAISNGALNLLDNSDFETGSFYWNTVVTNAGTATYTSAQSYADGDEATTAVGSNVFQLSQTAAHDTVLLYPANAPSLHGAKFFVSGAVSTPASVGFNAQGVSAGVLGAAVCATTGNAGGWTHAYQNFDATALSTSDLGRVFFGLEQGSGGGVMPAADSLFWSPTAGATASVGSWTSTGSLSVGARPFNTANTGASLNVGTSGAQTTTSGKYPITGGVTYAGQGYASSNSATVTPTLVFYNASNAQVGTATGLQVTCASSGVQVPFAVTAQAPATATQVAWSLVSSAGATDLNYTAFTIYPGTTAVAVPQPFTCQIDDVALCPIWQQVNMNMQAVAPGSFVPTVIPLAAAVDDTGGWFSEGGVNSGSNYCKWDATHLFSTQTTSLLVSGTGQASSLFTASGYSKLAVNFMYFIAASGVTATLTATFYSSGGIPLYTVNAAGVNAQSYALSGAATGAWTTTGTANIPVPAQAAFVKLSFTAAGGSAPQAWFTNVSVTPTGTLAPPPYLNGGWSEGVADIVPTVTLQRSQDNGNTWTALRYGNAAVSATGTPFLATTTGSFTATPSAPLAFGDAEYTPLGTGMADTSTSRALYAPYLNITATGFGAIGPLPGARSFYRVPWTDMWLIDPVNRSDDVILKVKSLKASRTEDLTKENALGRKRVVVIGDVVQGDILNVELFSMSATEWAALQVQMNKQTPLLLRSPDGEQWYVRFTKRDRERTWTGSYVQQLRTHSLELQEVDPTS